MVGDIELIHELMLTWAGIRFCSTFSSFLAGGSSMDVYLVFALSSLSVVVVFVLSGDVYLVFALSSLSVLVVVVVFVLSCCCCYCC